MWPGYRQLGPHRPECSQSKLKTHLVDEHGGVLGSGSDSGAGPCVPAEDQAPAPLPRQRNTKGLYGHPEVWSCKRVLPPWRPNPQAAHLLDTAPCRIDLERHVRWTWSPMTGGCNTVIDTYLARSVESPGHSGARARTAGASAPAGPWRPPGARPPPPAPPPPPGHVNKYR
jgi:hypothetical protein